MKVAYYQRLRCLRKDKSMRKINYWILSLAIIAAAAIYSPSLGTHGNPVVGVFYNIPSAFGATTAFARSRGAKRGAGRSVRSRGAGHHHRSGKNTNVNINRNVNVVIRHHHHGWRGRYWGAVVYGVTLGAVIVVAANAPPPPPDSSLCWTWTNAALTRGYWYYCNRD